MCAEAEERVEREGWSIDDILEEERDRKEAEARKRAVRRVEGNILEKEDKI